MVEEHHRHTLVVTLAATHTDAPPYGAAVAAWDVHVGLAVVGWFAGDDDRCVVGDLGGDRLVGLTMVRRLRTGAVVSGVGGEVTVVGWWWWGGRVEARGSGDQLDPMMRIDFGFGRKSSSRGAAVAAVGRGWWYGSDGCHSDDDDEMMVTMVEIGWWGVTMVRRLRRWSVLVLVEESQSPGEGVKNEFTMATSSSSSMANTATDNLGKVYQKNGTIFFRTNVQQATASEQMSEILDQRSSRSLLASDNDRPYAIYDKYKHNNIKFRNQSTAQYEHRRFLNLSSVKLTSHAIATMRSMGSRYEKDGDYKAKLLEKAPLLKPIHNQVY
ncbi:hypothetical protein Tco_0410550 [Tanacetum coccineum]